MDKTVKVNKNRMLVKLIENNTEMRKQQAFFALAERFRKEKDRKRLTASEHEWFKDSVRSSFAAADHIPRRFFSEVN